jgi:sec-independent protein translocase protein TatC
MNNLVEIKKRTIYTIIPYGVIFLLLLLFIPYIIKWILTYYAIDAYAILATESFNITLQASLIVSLIFIIPLISYHVYKFVSPALPSSKVYLRALFCQILGIEGFLIGSTIITKYVLQGLTSSQIVSTVYSLNNIIHMGLGIGVGTALSLQLILLIPIINSYIPFNFKKGLQKGGYMIILCYFISSFITPPDLLSTILVMLPLCLSYLLGLGIAQLNIEVKQKC